MLNSARASRPGDDDEEEQHQLESGRGRPNQNQRSRAAPMRTRALVGSLSSARSHLKQSGVERDPIKLILMDSSGSRKRS